MIRAIQTIKEKRKDGTNRGLNYTMSEDDEEKALNDDELTREEKIQKLEDLADEIGLDVEELAGGPIEDLELSGVLTVTVYDDDENVKHEEKVEF